MAANTDKKSATIILTSELGYERIAMACSACFARMMGFPDERIEDLKTMVAEAAINAIEHGNQGRPEAKVTFTMSFENDTLHVEVFDEGDGIKSALPKPDIERIVQRLDPPAGFGTFLIENLADQVEFNELIDGGHMVRMALRLQPA